MSGGILVYMRTLVDTPAGGASIFCAHVAEGGHGHDVGLTTAGADVSATPLPNATGTAITYRMGLMTSDVTASQSADLSGGKGFLAPSITGEFSIIDSDGTISQDIEGGHFVPVGWDVWVADSGATVQMQVVDYGEAGGEIRFELRSPSYLRNDPLRGVRTVTQVQTDPDDSMSPTDPAYLQETSVAQSAGMVIGSIDLSLKTATPIQGCVIARYAKNTLKQGVIASGTQANVPGLVADLYKAPGAINPSTGAASPDAFIEFWCMDAASVTQMHNKLNTIIADGYRIIISNGQWFFDTSLIASPFSEVDHGFPHIYALRVSLYDADGENHVPAEDVDPSQVMLYAVPDTIPISWGQTVFKGFARNGKTTKILGQGGEDVIQTLRPGLANQSEYIGMEAQTGVKLGFIQPTADNIGGLNYHDMGSVNYPSGGVNIAVSGSADDIVTDPDIGWNGGTTPVSMSATAGASNITGTVPPILRIAMRPLVEHVDCDFLFVETSYSADAVFLAGSPPAGGAHIYTGGPLCPDQADTLDEPLPAGKTITINKVASRNPRDIRWKTKLSSVADAVFGSPCIKVSVAANFARMGMSIYECFLWAVRKFSFSSIYSTVFPFWTQKNLSMLASDGAYRVVAGGVGVSQGFSQSQQPWEALTMPTTNGQPATVISSTWRDRGFAHGFGLFISAGFYPVEYAPGAWTNGAKYWYSTTGSPGAWTEGTFGVLTKVTRIRALNGRYVALFEDGTLQYSLYGTSWTAEDTGAGAPIYDIVFDGTNYVAFGPAGHVYTSPDLATWTDRTATALSGDTFCGVWTGSLFVCYSGGSFRTATYAQILANTWTTVALPAGVSGPVEEIAWNGSILTAVGAVSGILQSATGSAWTVAFAGAFDGLPSVAAPHGAGVVWDGGAWVVGGNGQIVTCSDGETWIPWLATAPEHALKQMRGRFFGGLAGLWNPLRWTGGKATATSWGIAFNPPENADSGTTASAGARKIAEEWWFFAGEMPETVLDGSSDQVDEDLPEINLGNIEDVATLITVQYQPFGGEYLGKAYVQNVDVDRATAGKPDSFFFAGWDATGNTNGLAIWAACRAAYERTGALRSVSLTYDSIHDPATLGDLWTTVDPDMGTRIDWLCERPRYLKIMAKGNGSAAARAYCGCRYKPNRIMLDGRLLPALNATGYGVVVRCDHNFTTGEHALELAFPPA